MRLLGVLVAALAFAAPALASTGNPTAGRLVFRAHCGSCHTFAAAGTKAKSSTPGPTLDHRRETRAKITNELLGSGMSMPAIAARLTQKQVADVTAYVISASK
jgi:mono/diheme cytochrome c family protein